MMAHHSPAAICSQQAVATAQIEAAKWICAFGWERINHVIPFHAQAKLRNLRASHEPLLRAWRSLMLGRRDPSGSPA
jgi:hypothetical protein